MTQLGDQESINHLIEGCTCPGKRCFRCKHLLCFEAYHRLSRSPDGRRADCKTCRKAERDTDAFRAKKQAYYKENADRINETKRAWSHANPERIQQYSERTRERHAKQIKIYQQKYNRSEPGKLRWLKYRTSHPEKVRQFSLAWKESHPEMEREHATVRAANYKAKGLGIPGKITTHQWRELKDRFGHVCLRCGQQEPSINLTIDHVIPFALHGPNEISNIQPLCEYCNTSKGTKVIDYRTNYNKEEDCG